MHLLRHNKVAKPKPFIPIRHVFDVPDHRRVRGKRYAVGGKFLQEIGPKRRADPIERAAVEEARRKAALLPRPVDTDGFDLSRFTPLPGRVLVKRPPPITQEKGIDLPEDKWRSPPFFFVVAIGPGVTECQPGDRVVFAKNHRPKEAWLGKKYYLGRKTGVVAVMTNGE